MTLDLFTLDHRIRAWSKGEFDRDHALEETPIPKAIASLDTLGELGSDPLSSALRPWVVMLIRRRVNAPYRWAIEEARRATIDPDRPGESLRTALRELTLGQGPESIATLVRGRTPLEEALVRFVERDREVARRLGVPVVDPKERAWAEGILAATDPWVKDHPLGASWIGAVRAWIVRDSVGDWPAHLTIRFLREALRDPFRAVGRPLPAFRLPKPIGASSFVRGFAKVGRAFVEADEPTGWFTVARDPEARLATRRAALFAQLPLSPVFHRRVLGVGQGRAESEATRLLGATVGWLRWMALKVECDALFARGGSGEDFEVLTERALGRPIPKSLFGVVPALYPEAIHPLGAVLCALGDRDRLEAMLDDDWFINPRLGETLLAEHVELGNTDDPKTDVHTITASLTRQLAERF